MLALKPARRRWCGEHRERGFTMAEMLVAMIIASFLVAGTWRALDQSASINEMTAGSAIVWEQLDLAADMISVDASLAAWSGTPHSTVDPWICPKPLGIEYRGLVVDDGETSFSVPGETVSTTQWGNNVHIDPDQCIFQSVVSHFNGTEQIYIFHPTAIVGTTIDFSGDANIPGDAADFNGLFTDRFLRITAPNGFSQFSRVTATDFESRQVTLAEAPVHTEEAELCGVYGTGGGDHDITVHTFVRYRIMVDPDDDTSTALVREELTPNMLSIVSGSRLVVARDMVDLQCWADGVVGATPSFRSDGQETGTALSDDQGTATVDPASNQVQRARVFNFQLTGRTAREFRNVSFEPRQTVLGSGIDLLRRFDIDGHPDTAALTHTVHQQVELSNFAVRNLQ